MQLYVRPRLHAQATNVCWCLQVGASLLYTPIRPMMFTQGQVMRCLSTLLAADCLVDPTVPTYVYINCDRLMCMPLSRFVDTKCWLLQMQGISATLQHYSPAVFFSKPFSNSGLALKSFHSRVHQKRLVPTKDVAMAVCKEKATLISALQLIVLLCSLLWVQVSSSAVCSNAIVCHHHLVGSTLLGKASCTCARHLKSPQVALVLPTVVLCRESSPL